MKDPPLDLEQLRRALLEATRGAYEAARRLHPTERLYVFALCTSPSGGYVYPTYNTVEAPFQLPSAERWSPEEFAYHTESDGLFVAVNNLIGEVDYFEERYDQMTALCVEVLKDLDAQGVFGTGVQRDELVLCVLLGDQSYESRLDFAQQLNPEAAWQLMARDFGTDG